MKNNLFAACFAASIGIHVGLFAVVSLPQSPVKIPKFKNAVIEVAYQHIQEQKFIAQNENRIVESVKKNRLPDLQTISKKNLFENKTDLVRKEIFKDKFIDESRVKKIISMPNIPGEVFKSPEHKDYYYIIREKIRRKVYSHFNKLEKGEVMLTFSLYKDGSLKELSVNNEKSFGSIYLRSIAAKSVREAAPFPPFPKALQENDKLTFTVTFKFEYR